LEALDSAESRSFLPKIFLFLAETLPSAGRIADALRACNRSLLASDLMSDRAEAAADRGRALFTRAELVRQQARTAREGRALFRLCDKAVAEFQAAGDVESEARVVGFKAAAMQSVGQTERAAALWEEADANLVALAPDPIALSSRATLMLNRAGLTNDAAEAVRYAKAAADLYLPLVREQGYFDLGARLGRALFFAGGGYERQGRRWEALTAYQAARSELEQSVLRSGQTEAAGLLALCYASEARLTQHLKLPEDSLALARQGVDLWRRVAVFEGRGIWTLRFMDARLGEPA